MKYIKIKNGAVDWRYKYKKNTFSDGSFCFVGRLVQYKGIGELIKAFRNMDNDNISLNIYGDGDDADNFKRMARNDNRIIFHGYTEKPLKVISENEFLILPSFKEGLSLSLIDAMMMGKVVIASDVDGNAEVVENGLTGILVPVGDIKKLTEAMEYVLNNKKEVRKMEVKARKKYEEEFDMDKIFTEKMLPLYSLGGKE